jgi:hypothetical protein
MKPRAMLRDLGLALALIALVVVAAWVAMAVIATKVSWLSRFW